MVSMWKGKRLYIGTKQDTHIPWLIVFVCSFPFMDYLSFISSIYIVPVAPPHRRLLCCTASSYDGSRGPASWPTTVAVGT